MFFPHGYDTSDLRCCIHHHLLTADNTQWRLIILHNIQEATPDFCRGDGKAAKEQQPDDETAQVRYTDSSCFDSMCMFDIASTGDNTFAHPYEAEAGVVSLV